MNHWFNNSLFYHIYPLGFCGAPQTNDGYSQPVNRLSDIHGWLDHIQSLGVNALYLGPVFESTTHGYDTANYYEIDRRLGTKQDLRRLSDELHNRGMHLVLDGVFNHVGRDFWAFKDLLTNKEASSYKGWFQNLRFGESSPFGDPFSYEGWNGHYGLVKLDLENPQVREHLFGAIEMWTRELSIDGIRLDAADCLSFTFLESLSAFCHNLREDFWLMGEVIHGDYRQWANPKTLDSVTNYELYKGLYSSHNDKNYFELAFTLNRQFGPSGLYRENRLYSFVDNHDVNRIASQLTTPTHLYPLHLLLYTVPGIPSIFYGSEFGIEGKKINGNDAPLRPQLNLPDLLTTSPQPALRGFLSNLASLRQSSPALLNGDYSEIYVSAQQFAFSRKAQDEEMIVAVNASPDQIGISLELPDVGHAKLTDLLNQGDEFPVKMGEVDFNLDANWGRILKVNRI